MADKHLNRAIKFSDGYELIYQPVAGTITILLPLGYEKSDLNELTKTDLENILEVVKELCERE